MPAGRPRRADVGVGDRAPVGRARPGREKRGLRYALFGFLGFLALILLFTLPPGAPLRDPVTGDIIGTTPFMDSLLFIIAMFFLISGIGLRHGRRDVQERERRHRGRDEDVRRPRPASSSCC